MLKNNKLDNDKIFQQKETDLARWHCHKEQDKATEVCSGSNMLSWECRKAEKKVVNCLKKQSATNAEKELFQSKTVKDW